MPSCAYCGEKLESYWNLCPNCEKPIDNFNKSEEKGMKIEIGEASVRPKAYQIGKGDKKTVIGDASVRAEVAQVGKGYMETTIGDASVRSGVFQIEDSEIALEGSEDDASKLFKDLQNLSQEVIIGDAAVDPIITQIQKITAKLEIRGFEYLVCSNPKCRETLNLSEKQKSMSDLNSIELTCDKCGTKTKFDDALSNAQMFLSSLGKKFGEVMSKIERGDVQDARIRSYIFQRDVVDYLAHKFLKICQFIKPTISTPYEINNPIDKDIEYGLTVEEYIEMIMTDSKLSSNPYVKELAGQEQDVLEGEKQSKKLRVIAFLLWGLILLKKVCKDVKDNAIQFPQSSIKLEEIETYFLAAEKTCFEVLKKFPNETFFENLRMFAKGIAKYVQGIRLYSHNYFLPNNFEDSTELLANLSERGTFELDQTKLSTIFTDPGKDRIRKNAERNLEKSTAKNADKVHKWLSDLQSMPEKIRDIAKKYKVTISTYISNKNSITIGRIAQISLSIPMIIYIMLLFSQVIPVLSWGLCLPNFIMTGGLLGIIILISMYYIAPKENNCINLGNYFKNLVTTDAENARNEIDIRSFRSQKVVDKFAEPLNQLEEFWRTNVSRLGWVSSDLKEQLLAQLNDIQLVPPDMPNSPPKELIKLKSRTKISEDEESIEVEEEMLYECTSCGAPLSIDDWVCPKCGEEIEDEEDDNERVCSGCFEFIPLDAKICPECGKEFEEDVEMEMDFTPCPKCKKEIEVPFDENEYPFNIQCPYCRLRGKFTTRPKSIKKEEKT